MRSAPSYPGARPVLLILFKLLLNEGLVLSVQRNCFLKDLVLPMIATDPRSLAAAARISLKEYSVTPESQVTNAATHLPPHPVAQ